MRLSRDVEIAVSVAVSEASRLHHEYAGLEHLLYALTFDEAAAKVLRNAGGDVPRIRRSLADYLETEIEPLPAPSGENPPRLSLGARRMLARAAAQVESADREEVEGPDLLVALFAERDSWAAALLAKEGMSRLDVVSAIVGGAPQPVSGRTAAGFEPDDDESARGDKSGDALQRFTQDLTELARRGTIDPLVGREREIERTLHILQRRRKNNPLYVGDPGVGKTALVEGLAHKIAADQVPAAFRGVPLLRLDLGTVVAGTRYRGDFEDRIRAVIAGLAKLDRPILFIDEIHTLVGAGGTGRGTLDASSLLKPALQEGILRCIGATSWEDFRQHFERDAALARRFQKIEVPEVSEEEAARIFTGLQSRYERHHGVTYDAAAAPAAASLAARYLRDRKLPDSAIDLLDESAATVALAGRTRVEVADIEQVLATMAQIPARQVQGDDRERLRRLDEELAATVFGQEEAIKKLTAAIHVARAGLRDPLRPVGCFLLTGPTGVGKTEIARQLAAAMGIAFLRFDMSEYMERHTVSRLVGAPPGYVGYDRGGLLTEAIAKNPHAVLLLDEIEKAHEDVFNLLLQVMDHGTLTDTNGKATDFRHTILLMTSNVGARELARRPTGFGAEPTASGSDRAVERLFNPEFRNRLDARLEFAPLSPVVMELIVDKLVRELAAQLAAKSVTIEVAPAARQRLAELGYDPAFGARPLARVIDEQIKQRLTQELLFGELQRGGRVRVELEGEALRLVAEPAETSESAAVTEDAAEPVH